MISNEESAKIAQKEKYLLLERQSKELASECMNLGEYDCAKRFMECASSFHHVIFEIELIEKRKEK